jgi:nucleolin
MGDRYIKVDKPMTPKALQASEIDKKSIIRPPGCRTVFVKNIPYNCTEEDMMNAFKVCGPIYNVRLPIWGHTQQLKGFGYVDFTREDSAEIAVKKSGTLMVGDRPLLIDFETGGAKRGFKSASNYKK